MKKINADVIFELSEKDFENSIVKNNCIAALDKDYMVLVNENMTNSKELLEIFEANDFLLEYDMVVFGENVPEGEAEFLSVISSFDIDIFALGIKRNILINTGSFNTFLDKGSNYEFLCRVAGKAKVFCVPCATENDMTQRSLKNDTSTIAYVLRTYMMRLKAENYLNKVFNKASVFLAERNLENSFNNEMNRFLSDEKDYEKVARSTAPFFIISGDDICHGVLKDFAVSLATELIKLGQAVITTDNRYGNFANISQIENIVLKGVIGFQAPILENDFFRKLKGKKFQFFLDNPAFFNTIFQKLTDDYYILCQDNYYAEFVRKYYNVKNALQFPPAGKESGVISNEDKMYNVVFIGTYNPLNLSVISNELEAEFFEYMLSHSDEAFDKGLQKFLVQKGIELEKEKFVMILQSLNSVCMNVVNYYREKTIETILTAGIKIDVYGDSWLKYDKAGRENLIIHPSVSVQESLEIMNNAKIGLNIMTWHKAGMTERIANIMLSGAVCVSDETVYLNEHFKEDEEIVLFKLKDLKRLPIKINELLSDEEKRKEIAKKAYERALKEHTWGCRARQLLELAEKE